MRNLAWVGLMSFVCATVATNAAQAQGVTIGPGGVTVEPLPRRERPDDDRRFEKRGDRRDEVHERMMELRAACDDGDRRSCIRFGIIIGEKRRAQWRRESRHAFWWERDR
jgi:hypothetical protein